MNQFGQQFRLSIFGESHGTGVGITLDGLPAGMPLDLADFAPDMQRRQGGTSSGTTPRKEADEPQFLSGLFNGHTTGAPLTLFFPNANTRSNDYAVAQAIPRPGHADFVARRKFNGFEDFRGGGHFSGRLTACLVAAGVVAKKWLASYGITVDARLTEAGGNPNVEAAIAQALQAQNSIGGLVNTTVTGLPIGLGSPFFHSLESQIAAMAFSIPAIKGIEFGAGFAAAKMVGSEHNDCIENSAGRTRTNHAGGINGGISNGNPLSFTLAVKPTSSTPAQQLSLNRLTGEVESFAVKGRHDLCIALRVPPVAEAAAAICLADAMLVEGFAQRHYLPTNDHGFVLHLCDDQALQTLMNTGFYAPEAYAREGFIHCCSPSQLPGVLDRHFAHAARPIMKLTLARHLLQHPLRYDFVPGMNEHFAHLYGPINAGAIWSVDKVH